MTIDERPAEPAIARMEGDAALPRRNGELVFQEIWEGRIFGLAVALNDRAAYDWEEFRQRLIGQVAAADATGDPSSYYQRWLAAFESLLESRGMVTRAELDARTAEFASGERDEVF